VTDSRTEAPQAGDTFRDTRRGIHLTAASAWYGCTVIVTEGTGTRGTLSVSGLTRADVVAGRTDQPDTRRVSVFRPQRLVC
jgi:hypothetical protein